VKRKREAPRTRIDGTQPALKKVKTSEALRNLKQQSKASDPESLEPLQRCGACPAAVDTLAGRWCAECKQWFHATVVCAGVESARRSRNGPKTELAQAAGPLPVSTRSRSRATGTLDKKLARLARQLGDVNNPPINRSPDGRDPDPSTWRCKRCCLKAPSSGKRRRDS
jgi:hypothetical protein